MQDWLCDLGWASLLLLAAASASISGRGHLCTWSTPVQTLWPRVTQWAQPGAQETMFGPWLCRSGCVVAVPWASVCSPQRGRPTVGGQPAKGLCMYVCVHVCVPPCVSIFNM